MAEPKTKETTKTTPVVKKAEPAPAPTKEDNTDKLAEPAPAPTKEDNTDKLAAALGALADSNKKAPIKFHDSGLIESQVTILRGKGDKEGQVFLRDNSTGKITGVQLDSIEGQDSLSEDLMEEV